MTMVKLSKGNTKLGKIMNVSLPPVKSCQPDLPCFRDCYAMQSYRQYPNTRTAWNHNFDAFLADPRGYFDDIIAQLQASNTTKFRWHVAGDIPCNMYLTGIKRVARELPQIYFLVYTKNYNLRLSRLPRNLRLVLSAWPGLDLPAKADNMPIAWLSHDARLDSVRYSKRKHMHCSDKCETCDVDCFTGDNTFDVIFDLH